jgi:hypothetical protein
MMVGQAAGALAALSAKSGIPPREVPPVQVQRALLEANAVLSLCKYSDVPPEHPFYKAVQISNLHGLIEPLEPPHARSYNISDLNDPVLVMASIRDADRGVFGVNEMLTKREMAVLLTRARQVSKGQASEMRIPATAKGVFSEDDVDPGRFVSRGVFVEALVSAFGFSPVSPARNDARFSLPAGHPSEKSVQILASLGILDLYRPARRFSLAAPVTRGEAVEMALRAMTAGQP